jgi:[glutamine synthetase] adenylyltransferase / [glutamine synthetase]-adenylyl-L-tyrosine phosphorylase
VPREPGSEVPLRRAAALRAGSRSLGELLDKDDQTRALLASAAPLPDRPTYVAAIQAAYDAGGPTELRIERRRRTAQIAARDLAGEIALEEVGTALADLADACLEVGLGAVGAPQGLAVVGMGKLGGRELNYASDIDLMLVAADDPGAAVPAAEALLRLLGEFSPEAGAYRIDLDLRPEGRSGALVRSLDGYLEYYLRWAHAWEFQALIKARAAAGNQAVAGKLIEDVAELIYPSEVSAEGIADIRRMKERIESHTLRTVRKGRAPDAGDVKLGAGGIRDIEFSVQLLQLVHGGADPSVRSPTTLDALAALVDGGYLAEDDGAGLGVAYRWLRNVEHRLQLWQERRVHRLPTGDEDRARLALTLGFSGSPAASASERFEQAHKSVLADVRGRFEKLFYRPMIEALAEGGPRRMSEEALKERLRAFGFRDVDRAARTLGGLVAGSSRRSKLFRILTPALLRFLAATPMPDEGLFSLLRLGEALSDRVDVLGALRENPPGISLLARVLGSGRILGEILTQVPEDVAVIAEAAERPPAPRERERVVGAAVASLNWREPDRQLDGLRRFKRRAMMEIAIGDISGTLDVAEVGLGLSDIADACMEAALGDCGFPFAVVGMGKLGGRELNYSSDIDVMFVHEGNQKVAEKTAEGLLRSIGEVTPEGQTFRIDAALRPEGKSGPLARSSRSYREYYDRWAQPWEHLALLKARPAAGDTRLGESFVEMTRKWAWPEDVPPRALAEIRHLKARMERERIPRGTEPGRHFKLGPGGISDIEFAVQVLQLKHAASRSRMRVSGTLPVLGAAVEAGLLEAEHGDQLMDAYRFLSSLRNRLFFMVGRPVDVLPAKPEELEALGIALGFVDQPRQELEDAYLRVMRRTRRITQPLIYD